MQRPMQDVRDSVVALDGVTTRGINDEAHGGIDKFWQRPELVLTPAHKKRALVTMEASQLLGFGPRLPAAVREIHEKMLAV